jgi:UDP-N-acetylmuramyl pentapeptide phosphotransferase/UDP-N-acetylglucosamine-1-phosphate transferase
VIPIVVAAVLTAAIAAGGTAFLRRRALAWGLLDVPNERSLHSAVTPRGGGIVLVATVCAGLAALAITERVPVAHAAIFCGAACLVAAIGWQDDRRSVSPAVRFLIHLIAAIVIMTVWGTFDHIALPWGTTALPQAVAVALTAVWVVGLCNAYNFMDGIDGLASGQAVIAGVMWVWACGADVPLVTGVAALIAAANLGFLWHNWPPARIFMGDVGSGFLGFAFAALPLVAYRETGDARMPVAALLILAPFVFDTTITIVRRLLRGENVVHAHRTHLYQRLVTSGWTHARVTMLYLAVAAICGAAAVRWLHGDPASHAWLLLALVLLFVPVLVALVERSRRG